MKIVKGNTGRGNGLQTLLYEETRDKFYVVSSINYKSEVTGEVLNETMIFRSDEYGDPNVFGYVDVWSTKPADHDGVICKLLTGELTVADFKEVK